MTGASSLRARYVSGARSPVASRARGARGPRSSTSRKLLKRKIRTSAANPSTPLSTAVAICWPTENEATSGLCGEDRQQQRLLDAGAAGREREHRGDHLHAEHEQRVADRAADVERVEQRPVGREPGDPARELPARHLAPVAAAVAQDRESLAHALPERPHLRRQQRERDQEQDPERRSGRTA